MRLDRRQVGVAFDMHGCPNRCRHCWLGLAGAGAMSEEDVRWGVRRFREYIAGGDSAIESLSVATWFREPDYGDDYRRLYDLEAELSDCAPSRYELLSVWRLARDDAYARWAKSVGPDTCQITFFGMRDTNDWFHRRQGAFDDALIATERLLDVGMKPRWQVFLTTKLLPELDELLRTVDRLRLQERVRDLGGRFQLFMHLPDPDSEARKIERLRPTADELKWLPEAILKPSREHLRKEVLWSTEEDLYAEVIGRLDSDADVDLRDPLWFFVRADWDVFANVGTLEPWWRLGNLKRDSVESIFGRFERCDALGLKVLFLMSAADLAKTHGDPRGQRVYSDRTDLLSLYRGKHCEDAWRMR